MKTLIAYASKYGSTETCAKLLQEQLHSEVHLLNLLQVGYVELADYTCVVIGGSIYYGKVQTQVTEFYQRYMQELLQKKLGLFLCCGQINKAENQLELAFPSELRSHATSIQHFGYQFNLEKMDTLSKVVMRVVAKTSKSESMLYHKNIQKMAAALQS